MNPDSSGARAETQHNMNQPEHLEFDEREFQPTPEQVAKAVRKSLLFQDACPVQAERARQIAEGRIMAQREGFCPGKPRDERQEQIRAGQRAAHQEQAPRHPHGQPQVFGHTDGPARKKPRNRNRNRNTNNRAPFNNAPAPQSAAA